MRAIFTIVFTLIAFQKILAQTNLAGTVVDQSDGQPLLGASIYLLSDFTKGTTTDIDGKFVLHLSREVPGDSVLVSYIGYRERVLSIMEVSGRIELEPVGTEMLTLEVLAEPLVAEEFKYVSVNKMEIYTSPAAKADPLLAVAGLPSVTTTDESAAISLRGSSSIETGVFLNNVPVYRAVRYAQLNGIGSFSLFNTSLIKEVTVFPGNPPLEFGNSTSGVVSITTDDSPISAATSSILVSPASLGYQRDQPLGKVNLKLFANYQPSQILQWMNPHALTRLKHFQSHDGGIYLYGNLSRKLSFKSYHYGLFEAYRYQYLHPTFNGNFDQNSYQSLNVSTVSYDVGVGKVTWNQGFILGNSAFEYSRACFEVLSQSLYQSLVFSRLARKFHWKVGLSWDRNKSEVAGDFFVYDYAVGESFPVYQLDKKEISTSVIESFGYAKFYFSDRLILGGGLRKNLNTSQPANYWSTQANLTHLIGKNWKMIAGVGRYHKFALDQNSTGSVFIESNQASLDVLYHSLSVQGSFSVFAKANKINDEQNQMMGCEVYAKYQFSHDLNADCSYSYLQPQKFSTYDMDYFLKTNLRYTPGYWTLVLNSIYRQGLCYAPVAEAIYEESLAVYEPLYKDMNNRLPAYFVLNLSVSRLMSIREDLALVIFGSLSNVTDHKNVRSYTYNFDYQKRLPEYLGRRLCYAGVQVTF